MSRPRSIVDFSDLILLPPNSLVPSQEKGGSGSGNFGHAGVVGHEGGSAAGSGGSGLKYRPPSEEVDRVRESVRTELARQGAGLKHVLGPLRQLAREGEPAVRVPPEVVDRILADDRLKSQFETHSSKGFFDPEFRAEIETKGLGIPGDIPESERPIYGYMKFSNIQGNETQYGNIELVMKPEIKSRATMTYGDSLNLFDGRIALGTPISSPNIEGINPFSGFARDAVRGDMKSKAIRENVPYVEIQIQGGVHVSDIARVHDEFSRLKEGQVKAFQDLGIEVVQG